jgi:hypothetical protein
MQVILPLGQIRQLAVLGAVLLGATAADAKIIYVNGADTTPGNGTTWAASFKYLQDALKVAVAGDSIYMAKGTYYPDEGKDVFGGDRELSFELNGLKIYGGFAGGETSLDQRNTVANPTILSGEIFPITDPESQGYERYWSLHVLVLKGNSTLDGLTVEKGRANGDNAPYNQGGGCLVPSGMTLTLVNCIFRENLAAESGGAVWGKVVATNCRFSDNEVNNEYLYAPTRPTTTGWTPSWLFSPDCQGGAITGDVTAKNCLFEGNSVVTAELDLGTTCSSTGGAISGVTIKLDECIFNKNTTSSESENLGNTGSTATSKGGAIAGNVTARNCTFTENQAHADSYAATSADPNKPAPYTAVPSTFGGAIIGEIHVVNCSFANNLVISQALDGDNGKTTSHGGALYMETKSTVENCTFYQNFADYLIDVAATKALSTFSTYGGGVYAASPVMETATIIASSTFVDNRSFYGAAVSCSGRVNFISNIFWYDGFETYVDGLFRDDQIHVLGMGRISNRLYPTPLTETKNILKGGMEAVTKSLGANIDFGDPPERTLIDQDPMFVEVNDPLGPDGIWRTKDDGLRLLVGSPATSIGHPLFIPKDRLDLDDDGNVSENVPVDAAGFMRIQNGKMELGAYELGDTYPVPEIVVEKPVGTGLVDGVSVVNLSATSGVATTFVIRNTGSANMTQLALTCDGVNASEFKFTQPLKTQLVPGDSTTFTVTFTPAAFGMRNAAIHINSNDEDESPFDIALQGSAPVPDIGVEYPTGTGLVDGVSTVDLSTSSGISRTFVIRNTGAGTLTQLALNCNGLNASEFKCIQPLKTQLAPGESTTFTVTFTPAVVGMRYAAIHISSNDPNESPFDIALQGSAPVPDIGVDYPAGTGLVDNVSAVNLSTSLGVAKTFVIRNTGAANLTQLALTCNGVNASEFKCSQPLKTQIAPGENTTFTVTFNPTAFGVRNAAIHITSNDSDESPFDIALQGSAPVPDIGVEYPVGTGLTDGSSVIHYGSIGASTSASRTFTIRNNGIAKLNILGISSSGTNAASFTASAAAKAVLAPGATTTFKVTFHPSGVGERNASIVINSNDPDGESVFLIKVTGRGVGAPEIFVSQPFSAEIVDGAKNNFGSVKKSLLHSKTFIIKNTGLKKLKNIAVSLKGSRAFTKTKLPVTSLSPGGKTKFTVTFKPGSLGKKTAALQITSNDADEGDLDINLVGTCVAKKSSSTLTKASDSLAERRSEGSGGVVTVVNDSEGLKYLVLTVEKSANWDSTKHVVEVSPNLLDWFSGHKHTTTLVNNANVLKVRDNTPIRDGKKRYIRVR